MNKKDSVYSEKKGVYTKSENTLFNNSEIPKFKQYNKSLVKSSTQKAVRRNNPESALRTAKSWMMIDANDFMRRLPVIIMEDAILHPKFIEIIEIMKRAGRKGFQFTPEEKDMLLTVVNDIAKTETRDDFLFINKDTEEAYSQTHNHDNKTIRELTDDEWEVVRGLSYRSSAGGLEFDVRLMRQMSETFKYRFLNKPEWKFDDMSKYFPNEEIKFDDIKYATDDDIVLAGVDFHC